MHQHKAFRQKLNLAKHFVGQNFRRTKLSSFLSDIFLSDKVAIFRKLVNIHDKQTKQWNYDVLFKFHYCYWKLFYKRVFLALHTYYVLIILGRWCSIRPLQLHCARQRNWMGVNTPWTFDSSTRRSTNNKGSQIHNGFFHRSLIKATQ